MALLCHDIWHLVINYLHFNFSFQFIQPALIAGFATEKKKPRLKLFILQITANKFLSFPTDMLVCDTGWVIIAISLTNRL